MSSERHVLPLPELLAPGTWDIRHIARGGHTSRASQVFAAPFDDTPFAAGIRVHEYAHLRFSPPEPDHEHHAVALGTLLAVEDARVNECSARAGFADDLLEIDDPALVPPDPAFDLRRATLYVIAAHRTGVAARARAAMTAAGDPGRLALRLADRALDTLCARPHPTYETTLEVARRLDDTFGVEPDEDPADGTASPCAVHAIVGALEDADLRLRVATALQRDMTGRVRWGRLRRVEEPLRSLGFAPARRMPGPYRCTDEGSLLRAPHRWATDRRVFARRVRLPGGSVLVDASGSMSPTPEGLLHIVEAAAGALVACYNGSAEGWGVIRVLARDGRRVADRLVAPPLDSCGNVIDGPALRWLASKPAPRIWVSDGGVTGVGDNSSRELRREAEEICRRAKIRRVAEMAEAAELLRGASSRSHTTSGAEKARRTKSGRGAEAAR